MVAPRTSPIERLRASELETWTWPGASLAFSQAPHIACPLHVRREIDIFGGPCVRIGWSVLIGEPADTTRLAADGGRFCNVHVAISELCMEVILVGVLLDVVVIFGEGW